MNTVEKTHLPSLAFLDVETTGLSPVYDDRVCEIAVVRVAPDGTHSLWQTLINPQRPISQGASAVNGITGEMVEDAPAFERVTDELLTQISDATVVCHNAPFDIGFISMEFARQQRQLPPFPVIDTLKIARKHFHFPSNSLGNIAAYLGIEVTEKHRALADAFTTWKVFEYMSSGLQSRGIGSMDELVRFSAPPPGQVCATKKALPPVLEEAIRLKRKVRMRYASRLGNQTRRVIQPLEIISSFDYLYLVAFCQIRKETRMFRLDRIIDLQPVADV